MVDTSEPDSGEYVEPAEVHFDDLDPIGNLHNGRYLMLVERALMRIWARNGYSFVDGVPTHPDVLHVVVEQTIKYRSQVRGVGGVSVGFRMERLGRSSMVYTFRVMSRDGQTVHAEGTRTEVNVDMATQRSAPWADATRDMANVLFAPASVSSG
ncbi:acyl-CoA thioesterase [Nonomuraea lactucae]|uniref:acyl-CoA thioesterase n=1 Tax=Nonomuraea lactucae TaxID=2249762 RepID=UPI000DE26D13|nr:thioesterase family protein [Nonomuraea lactucae]